MATVHGRSGVVRVGANPIAEVRSFEITSSVDLAEDTVMGDTWKTQQAGLKGWSGSVQCYWDESDTNGQVTLDEGASVTLSIYPDGTATGKKYYTGTVWITEVPVSGSLEGIVERSFNFTGNGAMTIATAP